MTEPTDAELEALAVEHEAFGFGLADKQGLSTHGFDPDGLRSFARAVLAKWGTPPAVAGEPVAWYEYNADLDAWFLAYSYNPKAKTRPLVFGDATQAQAGAVPLTDEQWQRIADLTDSILTRATKDEIERVIGIKGGQHGGM